MKKVTDHRGVKWDQVTDTMYSFQRLVEYDVPVDKKDPKSKTVRTGGLTSTFRNVNDIMKFVR